MSILIAVILTLVSTLLIIAIITGSIYIHRQNKINKDLYYTVTILNNTQQLTTNTIKEMISSPLSINKEGFIE